MDALTAAAVVIPARDEGDLLPRCLGAVREAARRATVPVRTIVVLDRCSDGSADACRRLGVELVETAAGNVGAARAAGVRRALAGRPDTRTLWLAHTDADSRVGPDWLVQQIGWADGGADAVLGVVHLDGPARVRHAVHQRSYRGRIRPDGWHDHVHGANLGIRASTYLATGGFRPLAVHEDRDLVERLERDPGVRVVRSSRLSWPRRALA
jgi:glycosyltransferase involved in cell wall biosynthesis